MRSGRWLAAGSYSTWRLVTRKRRGPRSKKKPVAAVSTPVPRKVLMRAVLRSSGSVSERAAGLAAGTAIACLKSGLRGLRRGRCALLCLFLGGLVFLLALLFQLALALLVRVIRFR